MVCLQSLHSVGVVTNPYMSIDSYSPWFVLFLINFGLFILIPFLLLLVYVIWFIESILHIILHGCLTYDIT